jgi:hypothetical protein
VKHGIYYGCLDIQVYELFSTLFECWQIVKLAKKLPTREIVSTISDGEDDDLT